MSIFTLNLCKSVETMIAHMNRNNLKSIRERIDQIEDTIGNCIAQQLRNQLWAQARALELI